MFDSPSEKKAMPLVKKLLKWVHSLFRQNNALSDKCDMLERSKAHEVGIWKRRFERAEEIIQQLRPKAEQYDHISRVLDQEQLTQLLSQPLPTHEPTTHRQKGAVR